MADPTAEDLLRSKPEDLYPGTLDGAKARFRELAQAWHPDKNKDPRAQSVFAHVSGLYDQAVERIEKGTWEGAGSFAVRDRLDRQHVIPFHRSSAFELGRLYVGDDHITYLVDEAHADFFANAVAATGIYSYPDDKMRQEVSRYLPKDVTTFQLRDGRLGMRVPKTADLLLLRDVVRHFGGQLHPRHVAWVMSTLYNLACYLAWAGVVHHNLALDTYLVSPQYHSGALLGGWWYAVKAGKKVQRLPARTFDFLPWEARTKKVALPLSDLELVRACGREMLGPDGSKTPVPPALLDWLTTPASGTALAEYRAWQQVLTDSFGPRKFWPMELDAAKLYPTK